MMRSLFRLLLRSLISAASAAFGAVSAVAGAIAAAIAAVIAALTGISIATIIPAIVIIVVLIIIVVVVVLIAFLFPPSGPGANMQQSPYPGITYSIVAQPEEPSRAERGQDISYKIYFLYNSAEAQTPLGSITLVSTFPPEVGFVSATGVYSQSPGSVRWVLSENTQPQRNGEDYVYSFDLVLRSDVDITITNSLSLEGAGEPNE